MTQKTYIRHSEQLISLIYFVKSYHKKSKACLDTYAAIARYWNPQGNIFPNQETLAALVGVQTRTIRTHISQLKKMGLLDFHQPNEKGKPPKSNHYTFIVETLKRWVEEAKKVKNAITKKLRDEEKALQMEHEESIEHDPAPPLKNDPPITSSLHSEDIQNITGSFCPSPLDVIIRDAHLSEDDHRHKLILQGIEKRRKAHRIKLFSGMSSSEPSQKWDEEIRHSNAQALSKQSRIDQLESGLLSWSSSGKGFTRQMLDELRALRDNNLSPVIKHFADKFKKAQLNG